MDRDTTTVDGEMAGRNDTMVRPGSGEAEEIAEEEYVPSAEGHSPEGSPLVLLQVNCRSICNKILEFWNLMDTYNPDVVIGTESWLSEEINNAEVFRDDYIIFRRDRCSRGGGVFIGVKNYIDCREIWVDEDFEILAVEIKGRYPIATWEIVGTYRAPNEDMGVLERLATRTGSTGNCTKRSIIGGDLNLPSVNWNGNAGGYSGTQSLINSLVYENGYSQVVQGSTRGDALLDVFLVRPESSVAHSGIVQGISDHQAVILEVKWNDTYTKPQVERLVPVYNKTDIIGLQTFLWDKYEAWSSNGKSVEEIWDNFKNIVYESLEQFVPHKKIRKNSDPEYYNKEIKRLKSKVRKVYNKRKLGEPYTERLKHLSKQLLSAKKSAQEAFLKTILRKEGNCWSDFYKYVRRRKGNRENIPSIKDSNGRIVTDAKDKANTFNSYYSTVFSSQGTTLHTQSRNIGEPFMIDSKAIRRRVRALGKNKSVGPDRISGDILKLGGEAMVSYLARLLDTTMNNGSLPEDWKRATVIPVHKGGDRSLVANYRPVSLTSVVCKQLEHVIASYLRQVWDKNDWLFEGQHGFRPGYSCESQVISICQDIADSLDDGENIDAIIVDFSKAFDLVPHGRLLTKIANSGVDPRVVTWVKEFLSGRTQRVRVEEQLSEEVRVTSGVPQGSVLGPLLFLAYINDIWRNMESTIRLFADDCVIYRKIIKTKDMDILQKDLDRLGEWADENEMVINPSKSKAIRFTRARANVPLKYSLMGKQIPQTSSCKYLGIFLRSDLSWVDQVNYTVKKAWKALHFTMRLLKKANGNTRSLAYRSLVRPILEYGAACWDPYREGQIRALDRVQSKAARFAHNTKNPNWETLTSRRELSRICALFKAYSGDRAWNLIGNRLKRPHYLSRVDHGRKIRSRKQRTDIGKYSFLNRTIQLWNSLPAEVFENLPPQPNHLQKEDKEIDN